MPIARSARVVCWDGRTGRTANNYVIWIKTTSSSIQPVGRGCKQGGQFRWIKLLKFSIDKRYDIRCAVSIMKRRGITVEMEKAYDNCTFIFGMRKEIFSDRTL